MHFFLLNKFATKIRVSCEGENPADIEHLGKNIEYRSFKGEQGFHGNYFPFMNTKGYLQPLVAVQFLSVKRTLGKFKPYLTISNCFKILQLVS